MKSWIKYTAYLIITTVVIIFVFKQQFNVGNEVRITTESDEWEHHSMAVNFAEGFGLYKLGGYAEFAEYHYTTFDFAFPFLRKLHEEFPSEYYHRNIGFSLVAGTIYRLTGNNVLFLRIFNVLLLLMSWVICIIALKHTANGKLSKWLILISPVLMFLCAEYINILGDDIYMIFWASLIFYQVFQWRTNPGVVNTVTLSLFLIMSLLFKSTLLLFPLVLPVFLVGTAFSKKTALSLLTITGSIVIYVMVSSVIVSNNYSAAEPYERDEFNTEMLAADWNADDSLYIDRYSLSCTNCGSMELDYFWNRYKVMATNLFDRQFYGSKKVILSGQSKYLLIDGNNNTLLSSDFQGFGSWMPLWNTDTSSFYYGYNFEISPVLKVIGFYWNNPAFLPVILFKKLNQGYGDNLPFIVLAWLQLIILVFLRLKAGLRWALLSAAFVAFMLSLYFGFLGSLSVLVLAITIVILFRSGYFGEDVVVMRILQTFIAYFILLTLILFGLNRYTELENCFVLSAIVMNVWYFMNRSEDKTAPVSV